MHVRRSDFFSLVDLDDTCREKSDLLVSNANSCGRMLYGIERLGTVEFSCNPPDCVHGGHFITAKGTVGSSFRNILCLYRQKHF